MQPHRLPRNLFAGLATITHSPRGLLCVRKSRAIRNGHEGPPRRSLFELSSECCPIELVVFREHDSREIGRPMPRKTKSPHLNGEVKDLRLNIEDRNLWLITEGIYLYLDMCTVLTFILLPVSLS